MEWKVIHNKIVQMTRIRIFFICMGFSLQFKLNIKTLQVSKTIELVVRVM